ncbi:MAG: hypothetical protein COS30_00430 [Candidatus Portnoybacteria bacterium CG02_land_8_20_14_3_00_45_8]|uniref:Type 4 fimbrial biogenesis protein PilX N-terminal domain-containing protein n=1 Tax=Candidatus Portnoybacteria bacterium CG02_land_8_20_14_3_00_45_8 TaxID=1974807 RepID=A0A2M7D6X6_9BACT|nr:MAG: hypothetical protein COS30_00430 [Candidatus Portnoybacteria bacterium CG02_land_8_20_14_3_00_45_8]
MPIAFLLKFKRPPDKRGFAAVVSVLIVLSTILIVVGAISVITFAQQKITRNSALSAQAYYAADSGIEDCLYRVIKGKKYQASNSLTIASSTAAISISDAGGQTIIRVNGEQANRWRNLQVKLEINAEDISFHYGVQIGEGGLTMNNSSSILGNLYSNGPVQGFNNASTSGDIFVASTPAAVDQQWTIYNTGFTFGQQGNQIDAAQSFMPTISDRLTKVSLYLKKHASPGNKTIRILTDNNNKPSKTLVASGAYGTLTTSQISQQNYGWIDVTIDTPPQLTAGTKYWIVVDASADYNNYFFWGADSTDGYSSGTGKYSPNWNASSPNWYSINDDLDFKVYLGDLPNVLSGIHVGGNAHANTITNCVVNHDAYYQTISDSVVNGTSYPGSPDPSAETMPISDNNIADWKAEAEAGGVISSYSLSGSDTASLGPKKINGNLTLSNQSDLTLTGTLYVTGNISLTNSAKLRLGTNYGEMSGVIIADGQISVANSATFYTNDSGAYILLLSTKTGDAISIANSASAVIFYASAGNVNVSNSATLKEVTAYQITLGQSAQVIYESGLASAKFSSGAGASWLVSDWQEIP